jgi:hypothetical protein
VKIISADPGLVGAICVQTDDHIAIFDIPTQPTKTGKRTFNIAALVDIIAPHSDADLFIIEDVHCLFGNGAVSMFNFGRGKGILEGIAFALKLHVVYVAPQTWKKEFPELLVPHIRKDNKPKTAKEKTEAAKAKRLAKVAAKSRARTLAGEFFPQLKDKFALVKSDGRAEAALIAEYARRIFRTEKKT